MRRTCLLLAVVVASAAGATPPADGAPFPLSCRESARPLVFEGWNALAHAQLDLARDALARALKEDMDCVLARALLGTLLVGPRGQRQFELALSRTDGLSELEQLELARLDAQRRADPEAAYALAERMAALQPEGFFVNLTLAHAAQALERWDDSVDAARRAIAVAPSNGAGWNLLGYAQLRAGRRLEAVAAFKRYVDVSPLEPNAYDSLGEALLEAGQLDEAEAAFKQALAHSKGRFTLAWNGLAAVRALRGDWAGTRAALAEEKKVATQPLERLRTDVMTAWAWAADGRLDTALDVAKRLERDARRMGLDAMTAEAAVLRAQLRLAAGQPREALRAFEAASRVDCRALTRRQQLEHRGRVLTGLTVAQARLGRVREAEKTLGELNGFLREQLPGPFAGDAVAFAHGAVALAKKRPAEAIESWQNCSLAFDLCRLSLLELQERAGEKAAAAETREALLGANHREATYWFVRARLEGKRRVSGT